MGSRRSIASGTLTDRQREVLAFFQERTPEAQPPGERTWWSSREVFDAMGGGRSKASLAGLLQDLATLRVLQRSIPQQPGEDFKYRLRSIEENLTDIAKLSAAAIAIGQRPESRAWTVEDGRAGIPADVAGVRDTPGGPIPVTGNHEGAQTLQLGDDDPVQ